MPSSAKTDDGRVRKVQDKNKGEVSSSSIRDRQFYKETYKLLQWQRDNYLVGQNYAEQRKIERQAAKELESSRGRTPFSVKSVAPSVKVQSFDPVQIPFDSTTLGHQQLVKLASWFIPTETVQQALVPLVVALPSGPLKQPILHGMVHLISTQQKNLDGVIKDQLTHFFTGDHSRKFVKHSANNYIYGSFHQSERRPSN